MSYRRVLYRTGVIAGSLSALACGGATPDPLHAPASSETSAPAAVSGAAPTATAAVATPAATPSVPLPRDGAPLGGDPGASDTATAPRSAKVADECSALCESATESCSHKSARECRANCGRYESLADHCEVQVLGAIRCQAATPKLVCSNLASECVTQFQALSACEQGTPTTTEPEPETAPLPAGWERIEVSELGFAVALPAGASIETYKGHRTWLAREASGVTYLVAVLPALDASATEKRLMEATIGYLGHKCQPAVRLHGRFETERDVAERFNARCDDGNRWLGILRASRQHLVLIAEVVPPGKQGVGDPFYYSFEYLK